MGFKNQREARINQPGKTNTSTLKRKDIEMNGHTVYSVFHLYLGPISLAVKKT